MIRKDNVSETNVEQEIFADEENEGDATRDTSTMFPEDRNAGDTGDTVPAFATAEDLLISSTATDIQEGHTASQQSDLASTKGTDTDMTTKPRLVDDSGTDAVSDSPIHEVDIDIGTSKCHRKGDGSLDEDGNNGNSSEIGASGALPDQQEQLTGWQNTGPETAVENTGIELTAPSVEADPEEIGSEMAERSDGADSATPLDAFDAAKTTEKAGLTTPPPADDAAETADVMGDTAQEGENGLPPSDVTATSGSTSEPPFNNSAASNAITSNTSENNIQISHAPTNDLLIDNVSPSSNSASTIFYNNTSINAAPVTPTSPAPISPVANNDLSTTNDLTQRAHAPRHKNSKRKAWLKRNKYGVHKDNGKKGST